jgi:GNAT superfamily N-acetyltransferase
MQGDRMSAVDRPPIRRLVSMTDTTVTQLADVLTDCVAGGASVSFMHPLDTAKAEGFWRALSAEIAAGDRVLLVAEDATGIVGTVQLVLDQPDNQPHRADVAKMLVHRRGRGRGLGFALMRAAESEARAAGKTLLVLDTVTGSDAERLYQRLGWSFSGTIPEYALLPFGGLCSTSFYYRKLG